MEHAEITYAEGGSSIPWKMPGKQTFADLTLERGTSSDESFYTWAKQTSDASSHGMGALSRGKGNVGGSWVRQGLLFQLDRDASTILRRWRIVNAWCKKIVASDGWDATSDEVVMESLILAYDWFELA
jgi:phage tail-like protein